MQPTGCLRDSACRLQRGGGIVGWGWCFQVRASSELQFGALREVWRHARGREHCYGKPGSALSGGYAPDSGKAGGKLDRRRVRGVLNLCARESNARTGRFLREKLITGHGLFSSYEDRQGTANGQDSWGFFRDAQGFGRLDAGSRADFTSSSHPPPWTSVFPFFFFLYDAWP